MKMEALLSPESAMTLKIEAVGFSETSVNIY
jgi:hypothetical protein